MEGRVHSTNKQQLNNLSLEALEAMLAEEMEEQDLFGCFINYYCDDNTGKR